MNTQKHFCDFYSLGTICAEISTREMESWDIESAKNIAKTIVERHGATPYGFIFYTKSRSFSGLDSSVVASSPFYYLGGKIQSVADLIADGVSENAVLIQNMKINDWEYVITTTGGWGWSQPLRDGDVVLDMA